MAPYSTKEVATMLRITVEDVYRARQALGMRGGQPLAMTPQEVERLGEYLHDTLIAHCGTWHVCTALPWTCPQCGEEVGHDG